MTSFNLVVWFILIAKVLSWDSCIGLPAMEQKETSQKPLYLYKIISLDDWKKSQSQDYIILSEMDEQFIHLSTEEQLGKIIDKYWSNAPDYVILKLKTDLLPGKLVLEANPGGENKYYHLYNGSIPLKSIVNTEKRLPRK